MDSSGITRVQAKGAARVWFGQCLPVPGALRDRHQVRKTTEWVASRYRDGVVSAEYEVVHEGADLAYTVGYETGDVALDGSPVTRQRLRVTQIYRREDGQWRLVHRHGDFAPAEPGR